MTVMVYLGYFIFHCFGAIFGTFCLGPIYAISLVDLEGEVVLVDVSSRNQAFAVFAPVCPCVGRRGRGADSRLRPTLRGLIEESGRELAAEIATDVLIIEDETFIAMDIEALVEGLGHRVIGVARTHSEAVALAHKKRPGLILADIQLADGSSGLDAVNELLGSFEAPVIFITAYPERFLTGQRPEPAFLIAKPFQLAVVSAVASQALFFGRKAHLRERA